MTNERAGSVAAATSREFTGGQRVFGRYTLVKVVGRGSAIRFRATKTMKADATLSADTEAYVADGFGAEALF